MSKWVNPVLASKWLSNRKNFPLTPHTTGKKTEWHVWNKDADGNILKKPTDFTQCNPSSDTKGDA